jgi:excisionase family DNA binding protein
MNPRAPEASCDPEARRTASPVSACVWLPDRPLDLALPTTTAELLDFDQARHLLALSRNTLYRLLRAGEIPGARRVGKAWRFHRATLLHWIATGTGAPRRGRRR